MKLIQVCDLVKIYQVKDIEYPVINGVHFEVNSGDFISICGPSGSGKTTLLYLISGLEPYSSGNVLWKDQHLHVMNDQKKSKLRAHDMGFVFQFYNLVPNLTVYENMMLANVIGKSKKKSEIIDLLKIVGMNDYLHFYPNQLSGGMQQRVSIARALINDPAIIFADEPTGSLDFQNGILIMDLFKKLNKDLGITILMVTHNKDMASYGNRVIQMLDGKIIEDTFL
jgi:putative ABC transport system ATP-binding protein